MNTATNPAAKSAALRTILAACAATGSTSLTGHGFPYDLSKALVSEHLVDTDGTQTGWTVTAEGRALAAVNAD